MSKQGAESTIARGAAQETHQKVAVAKSESILPPEKSEAKIGIIGTGLIARGLSYFLQESEFFKISRILTRRSPSSIRDLPVRTEQITNSAQEIAETSDLVVECSGDPVYATEMLKPIMAAGIPVVTMDSELQVTTGSYLIKKGFITEAEGDQPGCLAALYKDAVSMGFKPLVFGNIKGFLNHNPTPEEMLYWANKNGISLTQVTSFTDGTKVQIEQALIANYFGAHLIQKGMLGIKCEDYQNGARDLAAIAESKNLIISDYVLSPKSPAGIFIVATHSLEQAPFLKYYKLGDGPYYVLTRPFHLCHLEICKTIKKVLCGEPPFLNNGIKPEISVATIAKRKLLPGEIIKRGIGGFEVRGEAMSISDNIRHLPIGLVFDIVIKRQIDIGQTIEFDDVEIPESEALFAWQETIKGE